MLDAELLVRIPKNWMSEVTERYGVRLRIVDRKPYGQHGVQDLVELELGAEDPKDVLAAIRGNGFVARASLQASEEGRALANVSTRCLACRALAASRCFLIRASTRPDGILEWELIADDREQVSSLVARLEKVGCEVTLGHLKEVEDDEALTRRQEEILRVAFERGYFDYPKRASIRDLAATFHVSISTISEILRKGQTKVFSAYFGEKKGS